MDKTRLEKYRKRLQRERRASLQSIQRSRCEEADLELNSNIDEGDVAVNSYEKDLFVALQDSDAIRLKAVDDALNRLEKEEWGLCATCGEPIPIARLSAVPWAALCVRCQDRTETANKDKI